MTYTFVKDITNDMIDETLSSFFEENEGKYKGDIYEKLVEAMDEKQQEDLLCDIELRAIAYVRDDIHERLRS